MKKLDIFNQPPQFYIFHNKANKTTFGGIIFIFFMLFMIFVSLFYIFDYILNEKYEIEFTRYYSPISDEKRELIDSDPELNPTLNFTLDGTRYINRNYSSNFFLYDKISKEFYQNASFINITKNVSNFHIELLYKCNNIDDKNCYLRDEDKDISRYGDFFGFKFIHSSFILDHSKPDPFDREHNISYNFIFSMNNFVHYSLDWRNIKYRTQKGIFELINSWRGIKSQFTAGYVSNTRTTLIPPQYRYSNRIFNPNKYRVIGSIQIQNLHTDYDEYKRKEKTILSSLADIGALFSSVKGIIITIFAFYSNNFDNHKMIKDILLKKVKKNSGNKNKKVELMPLDNNDNNDNLISNKDNLIINEADDENESENINLKKVSFLHYWFNNIYCKSLGLNIQERIETSNEIIKTYMSYECILYNQIMLENLFLDYKWNDDSLKDLKNNKLIEKIKNLEFEFT
jgi:hypothetical protein